VDQANVWREPSEEAGAAARRGGRARAEALEPEELLDPIRAWLGSPR